MILIIYISSLAAIGTGCFILGFHVLLRDRSSRINRLFFINSLLLNAVILITILIQLSHEEKWAEFIQGIYNITLILFLLESLYFSLVFTGRRMNAALKAILSVMSAAVFIIFILKSGELLHVTKNMGLWVYELVNLRFWFFIYSPLLILIVVLMLYTLHRYSINANSNKEKKQARVMMISILTACSTGFCFLMLLPMIDTYRAPLLTPYFFAVYLYGVFFAMTEYRFMAFNINDIAQDILSHIQDMVIILGPDKRIIEMNKSASVMLGAVSGGLKGSRFAEIVFEKETLNFALDSLLENRISTKQRITYRSEPDAVVTDSTVSAVPDRFGDLSAILIISRENRGVNHFRNYFKLTAREMEIILYTISGFTNIETAKKLDITKRTVETHQNNIYNKLGISNKIELLNITTDFGIKPL